MKPDNQASNFVLVTVPIEDEQIPASYSIGKVSLFVGDLTCNAERVVSAGGCGGLIRLTVAEGLSSNFSGLCSVEPGWLASYLTS